MLFPLWGFSNTATEMVDQPETDSGQTSQDQDTQEEARVQTQNTPTVAEDLEKKLEKLQLPTDQVPGYVSKDKIYSVKTRYSSLKNRHEVTMFGANNFTPDSHIDNTQVGLSYRYHINSDWSLALRYKKNYNELSKSGESLYKNNALLPDTDFAKTSTDLHLTYNTFYGKMRFSQDSVVYFDHFISAGGGKVELASSSENMYILDTGFAFWIGKNLSARIGLANEFYNQQRLNGSRSKHNAIGFLSFGYLFGEGDTI